MIIVYKMQYAGNIIESDMKLIPFENRFYPIYEPIYNECFYEMRKALHGFVEVLEYMRTYLF